VIATVAAFAATRSLAAAIAAHAGLNAVHFLFFSYPAMLQWRP
jgi:membrane protease YdiL (CAAX protease family)